MTGSLSRLRERLARGLPQEILQELRARPSARLSPLAVLALGLASCDAPEAEPRPQVVLFVDTDANVPDLLALDARRNVTTTIDTIRVDVLSSTSGAAPRELRVFTAPNADDWPLSLGLADEDGAASRVLLRIRGFSSRYATTGEALGERTVDPPRVGTVDRLVSIDLPRSGVVNLRVVLRADCFGVLPDFTTGTTCVDAARRARAPGEAVERVKRGSTPPREVGTWSGDFELPCTVPYPPGVDALCVPGGLDLLGDDGFVDLDATLIDSGPPRQVALAPYFLDRAEMTVGRYRALLASGSVVALPVPYDPDDGLTRFCTWLGPDTAENDAFPLSCGSIALADAACQASGGSLPSEAQIEHASRGRGRGYLFPWGNVDPTCCSASLSREGQVGIASSCAGSGVEPAGSHPPSGACPTADVSFDGILDLAGSLVELTADAPERFDAACWQSPPLAPTLEDPVCEAGLFHVGRGGHWNAAFLDALAPLRSVYREGPFSGFRCAYRGAP